MKTLPTVLLSAAVGSILTFVAISNPRVQTALVPDLPSIEFQNGFTFNVPCLEHGTDAQTVTGNRLLRVYEISADGEVQGEATGEQLTEVIELMKAMGVEQPNEESGK